MVRTHELRDKIVEQYLDANSQAYGF